MIIDLRNSQVHEHFVLARQARHHVKVMNYCIYVREIPKISKFSITNILINISGDSGSGYYVNNGKSFQIAGVVSAAVIQECGTNDFVLFTD